MIVVVAFAVDYHFGVDKAGLCGIVYTLYQSPSELGTVSLAIALTILIIATVIFYKLLLLTTYYLLSSSAALCADTQSQGLYVGQQHTLQDHVYISSEWRLLLLVPLPAFILPSHLSVLSSPHRSSYKDMHVCRVCYAGSCVSDARRGMHLRGGDISSYAR